MITVEQAKENGAASSKIVHIDIYTDEISFCFTSEKEFVPGRAWLRITGKLSDFEELYNKAKQAVSLIDEPF